jgi:hypothetical protein
MTPFAWDAYVIGVATGLLVAIIVMPYAFVGWFLFFAATILGVVYAFVLRDNGKGDSDGKNSGGD